VKEPGVTTPSSTPDTIVLIHGEGHPAVAAALDVGGAEEPGEPAQGRDAVERDLARAPEEVRRRFRWLPLGVGTDLDL